MQFRYTEVVTNILRGTDQQRTKLINRLSVGFYCTTSGNTNNPEKFTRTALHFLHPVDLTSLQACVLSVLAC